VLLAAACIAQSGQHVLDAGAGVGVVGLCVARRLAHVGVTLVERAAEHVDLAIRNVTANELSDRVSVVHASLTMPLQRTPLAGRVGTLDHVVSNPPFHDTASGTRSAIELKDAAHAMQDGDLDRWVRFMAAMAAPTGMVTLIHRAERLGEILAAFDGRFGGTLVWPVHPRPGTSASRILVQARKGSRAPLRLLSPLVLHDTSGNAFTPGVEAALRGGEALVWPI
jgi:tRNA1(Val) A37 N6-methylase TrmN6